jgi:hypothetical protein
LQVCVGFAYLVLTKTLKAYLVSIINPYTFLQYEKELQ